METSIQTTRVEDLLAHAEWLRRLAGRLVAASDVDDLLQETWKSALRAPPRGSAADARPWLARVLRNLTRNRWRTRTRADRTAAAAPPHSAGLAADELLERARTERRLADIVLTLEEPYRSAILLRYYEGKSGAEIAAALGIPAGTVRWRLSEAINRLRTRLDEEHGGDRERWRALLLPIAILPAAPVALIANTSKTSTLAAVAGAAVLAVSAWGFCSRPSPEGPVGSVAELPAGERRPLPELVLSGATLPDGRGAAGSVVEGVVLDPDGAPVARARVVLSPAARQGDKVVPDGAPVARAQVVLAAAARQGGKVVRARSEAAGQFRFDQVPPGQYVATASDDRWAGAFSSPFILAPGGRHRITLHLSRGGQPLEGQILDEGGGPIPRARVWAQLGYPWSLVGPPRRFETIADEQGRYRLVLEPREYQVRATARGYAPDGLTVALTRPLRRDIRLQPAAEVSGRVVEERTGAAVAGATVWLSPSRGDGGGRNGQTDEAGNFLFDDVLGGNYRLFAARGSEVALGPPLSVAALDRVEGAVLALAPGQILQGRITDPAGRGIGGVSLRLWSSDPLFTPVASTSRTTLDGAYRLEGLLPGSYQLTADGTDIGFTGAEQTVQVKTGSGGRLDLTLTPASLIRGRVVGVDGTPARGVLVRLEGEGRSSSLQQVLSDDQGRFQLPITTTGPVVLSAWERGGGVASLALDLAPGKRDRQFELRLAPGASLSGQVLFSDRKPAAGASVAVTRQEGTVVYDSTSTDDLGRFSIAGLMPGRYTVVARRKANPMNLWTSSEGPEKKLIDLEASEQRTGVMLEVAPGGQRISGIVKLPDGTPAVGSRVLAASTSEQIQMEKPTHNVEHAATAGPDGRFLIDDLEPGAFDLWASSAGYPDTRERSVAAGRTDLVLKLTASARIAGRVVTADDRPVSDFVVSLVPAPVANPNSEQEMLRRLGVREPERLRAADGRFTIGGLAAGAYQVEVTAAEGASARHNMTVAAGETSAELRFVLAAGATLTGKVVSVPSGQPLAAEVEAELAGRRRQVLTDSSGRFTLTGIPAGELFDLEIRARDEDRYVPEQQQVVVPAGTRTLDVGAIALLDARDWRERWERRGQVGLRPVLRDGRFVVAQVQPGGPAARAGLLAGDVILAVDGHSLRGMSMGAAAYHFATPPGIKLTLSVRSPSGQQRTVELVPEKQ